ncbi:MAG: ribonuclease HII [bacterium]|nr:ribonuclease HII [bacterium]
MKYPNLYQEKKLWKKGYKTVVGLDEAGRGPLAGPVVAGAVSILDTKYQILNTKTKVKDSKQLSSLQREIIYKTILKDTRLRWGIGIVSEKVIDRINILEATKLAMVKALRNLNNKLHKLPKSHDREKSVGLSFLILDGNFKLNLPLSQKSIVKGDEKVFSCAAASILAKVTRDRIMVNYHKKYPRYRFDLHKGYGTKLHLKQLKKYGPCKIHRKTFRPIT